MFLFLRRSVIRFVVAGLTFATTALVAPGSHVVFAAESSSEDGNSLTIDEKDQASSPRDGQLIILINLQNVRAQIDRQKDAYEKIRATAMRYAKIYLAKPQYAQMTRAVVYPVYIQSMDEYRQANFAGMVRLGTISFERAGSNVSVKENKLSLP